MHNEAHDRLVLKCQHAAKSALNNISYLQIQIAISHLEVQHSSWQHLLSSSFRCTLPFQENLLLSIWMSQMVAINWSTKDMERVWLKWVNKLNAKLVYPDERNFSPPLVQRTWFPAQKKTFIKLCMITGQNHHAIVGYFLKCK